MARFVFQFDAVLRQRLLAEQERQRDLAVLQAEMVRLKNELKALNDSIQSSAADLKDNRLTGPIDVAFLAAHRRYSMAMQRKGMQLVQDMARQQRRMDDAQRLLAEAAKDRKVMEKLREKQYERWRAEQAGKELAATDEVGMQLAQRQALNAADR